MALQLSDMGQLGGAVVRALNTLNAGSRREIAEHTSLTPIQVSRALNRLESMALVEPLALPSGPWTLTPKGQALFPAKVASDPADVPADVPAEPAQTAAEPAPAAPEMSAEMSAEMSGEPDEPDEPDELEPDELEPDELEPDFDPAAWTPEPISAPPPRSAHDTTAADLLAAMEIEVALDHVRTKLRSAAIPSRAQRVYHEVLGALPPVLVDALAPVTALVDAHNL